MSCISFLWRRCLPRKKGKLNKNQKDISFNDNSTDDAFVQEICDIIAVLDQVNIEKDEEECLLSIVDEEEPAEYLLIPTWLFGDEEEYDLAAIDTLIPTWLYGNEDEIAGVEETNKMEHLLVENVEVEEFDILVPEWLFPEDPCQEILFEEMNEPHKSLIHRYRRSYNYYTNMIKKRLSISKLDVTNASFDEQSDACASTPTGKTPDGVSYIDV